MNYAFLQVEMSSTEINNILRRYARRTRPYPLTDPAVFLSVQDKERAIFRWIRSCGIEPLGNKSILDIGCGIGGDLCFLNRLGFPRELMVGNELRPLTLEKARHSLPGATFLPGDACQLTLPSESFDVVMHSTVFSSILEPQFRRTLAMRMWNWTKPGGGILWYDFVYNNPSNPDVCGIPVKAVRQLFPEGSVRYWRVTLAPPISRAVTRFSDRLYSACNCLPFLRTHVLCWIEKPR